MGCILTCMYRCMHTCRSGALPQGLSTLDFVIWSLTEPWGSNPVSVSRLQAYATIQGFICLGSGVRHWSSCFQGGHFIANSQSMDCLRKQKKNTITLWIDQLHCILIWVDEFSKSIRSKGTISAPFLISFQLCINTNPAHICLEKKIGALSKTLNDKTRFL